MNEEEASVEASSRRTLAAIVFTDVAGFSALMETHEDRTLALVHRDLAVIRNICEKSRGRVLKTTGDGVLMYFDSAVQAVACALEVQQALADAAKTVPPEDVLRHRIGIHLGDVFLSETDVMGDGVNVAARLQGEAEPGGICISQTVYDVVKNRLAVKATFLGARELKNIKEAVPVYQILLEAAGAGAGGGVRAKKKSAAMTGLQWMVIGTVVAVVALAVVLTVLVLRSSPNAANGPTVIGPAGSDADGRAISLPPGSPNVVVMPSGDADFGLLKAARQQYLSTMNIEGMSNWLKANGGENTPLAKRYEQLKKFPGRLRGMLATTSEDKPLKIEVGRKSLSLWSDGISVTVNGPDGQRQYAVNKLPPAIAAAAAGALVKSATMTPSTLLELREMVNVYTEELRAADLLNGHEGGHE